MGYTTDGGKKWETRTGGELLGPNKDKFQWHFSNADVTVTLFSPDDSKLTWSAVKRRYNVWIVTDKIVGAKGQCVEGALRHNLRPLQETSGGVSFPSNPTVTKQQAEKACD